MYKLGKMANILFTASNSLRGYGGGEKWSIKVLNGLVEKGHDVTALYLSYLPGGIERMPMEELLPKLKFKYREFPYKRSKLSPLHMAEKIDYSGYDVIYTYTTFYLFLKQFLAWSQGSGAKRVFGLHNPVIAQGAKLNMLERKTVGLIPQFDTIHLLDASQTSLFSSHKEKIRVLPNSYIGELPEIRKMNAKSPFTILFVGRHETNKGFDLLMEVASGIPENIQLVILGSGSRSVELNNISKPNVAVEGFVSEERMNELMETSHVLLFPSVSEASSAVPMEALAFGLPIIYRDIPSNKVLAEAPGCKLAKSSREIMDYLETLKVKYESNPEEYEKMRKDLQKFSQKEGDYVDNFLNRVLLG